jgi:hypothetical protein
MHLRLIQGVMVSYMRHPLYGRKRHVALGRLKAHTGRTLRLRYCTTFPSCNRHPISYWPHSLLPDYPLQERGQCSEDIDSGCIANFHACHGDAEWFAALQAPNVAPNFSCIGMQPCRFGHGDEILKLRGLVALPSAAEAAWRSSSDLTCTCTKGISHIFLHVMRNSRREFVSR